MRLWRLLSLGLLLLTGCVNHLSPATASNLAQGQRYFETGYYKSAMRQLLPLACEGNADAQYAVGYMYYYGYGVTQDTDTGTLWIQHAASKGNTNAAQALKLLGVGKKHQ